MTNKQEEEIDDAFDILVELLFALHNEDAITKIESLQERLQQQKEDIEWQLS